jgi:hypothetical protein
MEYSTVLTRLQRPDTACVLEVSASSAAGTALPHQPVSKLKSLWSSLLFLLPLSLSLSHSEWIGISLLSNKGISINADVCPWHVSLSRQSRFKRISRPIETKVVASNEFQSNLKQSQNYIPATVKQRWYFPQSVSTYAPSYWMIAVVQHSTLCPAATPIA